VTDAETLGVLEITPKGVGFLRRREHSYLTSRNDVHVGRKFIHEFGLRTGDEVAGEVATPPGKGKSPSLTRVIAVNGRPPEGLNHRPRFNELTAIHPNQPLKLDCSLTRLGGPDYTNRVIDLMCPLGLGQRAMIVAPAKAGKTYVLQALAEGIAKNRPDALLLILLVEERPEEVTEMEACGYGEVIASTFDFPATRHVAVAELTLERARRRVEMGADVVIILDSITRLARSYNRVEKGSGRTLSGGLDATSMEKPKRFLGSARNIDPAQGGGSLTIIGTALVDTGSRMDQVIFEEFKGTGNMELVLDRDAADRRIWPAIDVTTSGTRKEEKLVSPEKLKRMWALRRLLTKMKPLEGLETLIDRLNKTRSNEEFLALFDPK
jgi:transcription termination factor Rho